MSKIRSISCIDQELRIDIIKVKGKNGDNHLTIKVTVGQTFEVGPSRPSMPVRRIQRLVTQELELY